MGVMRYRKSEDSVSDASGDQQLRDNRLLQYNRIDLCKHIKQCLGLYLATKSLLALKKRDT